MIKCFCGRDFNGSLSLFKHLVEEHTNAEIGEYMSNPKETCDKYAVGNKSQ